MFRCDIQNEKSLHKINVENYVENVKTVLKACFGSFKWINKFSIYIKLFLTRIFNKLLILKKRLYYLYNMVYNIHNVVIIYIMFTIILKQTDIMIFKDTLLKGSI